MKMNRYLLKVRLVGEGGLVIRKQYSYETGHDIQASEIAVGKISKAMHGLEKKDGVRAESSSRLFKEIKIDPGR